jgi:folate-dependent phosphoribosylglycinamide formyltransferase PurN
MLTTRRPLRVAVLCSRRAPGLRHLLESDTSRGHQYEVGCLVSTEPQCADGPVALEHGIPVVTHSIAQFYESRGSAVFRDFVTRRAYDRATVDLLASYQPDVVVLAGYLYLLTTPMLNAFSTRVVNLHFTDLTVRRADRRPAYVGIRAVRDAIADGQAGTCATVHLVNEEPDGGAPLVRSWIYPVSPLVARARAWDAADMVKAYAYAHQEWMIRSVSGPLLSATLQLIAGGSVDLDSLGTRDPAAVRPWLVDERGRLTPPSAIRIHDMLRGYQRVSA